MQQQWEKQSSDHGRPLGAKPNKLDPYCEGKSCSSRQYLIFDTKQPKKTDFHFTPPKLWGPLGDPYCEGKNSSRQYLSFYTKQPT